MSNSPLAWRTKARAWSPLLVIAAALFLLQVAAIAQPVLTELLEWSRHDVAQGQWWRLLTGHWVHLGWHHLLLNLAGITLLCILFDRPLPARWLVAYLLAAPFAISLGLASAVPELDWYRGFSGCLHGLFVALALANLRRHRRWCGLLLVCLALKLGLEPFITAGTGSVIGAPVIYQAHWLGAITGLVPGLLWIFTETRWQPSEG